MKLLSPFGVELTTLPTASALVELILEHGLVLVRGQSMTTCEAYINYARAMGELLAWNFGLVNELKIDDHAENYLYSSEAVPFHWDGAFKQSPAALLFHCITAPNYQAGGETLFTHTTRIYDEASDEMKKVWAKIKITYETEQVAHYGGCVTASVLSQHPYNRKVILRYAEPVFTELNPVSVTVAEMDLVQQKQFIEDMAVLIRNPRYCYQHTWRDGDLLFADNHALIHGRLAIKSGSSRHIRRIQVAEFKVN
ncbi:TauD/TfdA dioxygenase family protein [Legionella worsleiensis]|uniref:Pyoverdine biosynthesis protein PvcB n=1 Tax=Legionella worsleiensis TaxID=45076 RepID=A0A0W1AA76_9GAMM|nr:TauD/TfdA family dioxygenase [Legionella worsleiensis]KTD78246.1 pyoverdine biosynthesis protein PvcB [Legionella worsleiensis]STY32583.1 pyoverdine biosynthesis protein PvcB [Legionella worsleiensis]